MLKHIHFNFDNVIFTLCIALSIIGLIASIMLVLEMVGVI